MEVSRAIDGAFERGDDARFTGDVWLRSTVTADDGTNVGVVHFAPSARTHWHRHPGGQFLFVVSGRGRARSRGQAGVSLEPADVIHVGGQEWHFHGGDPDAPLVHVAVSSGGSPEWSDPVTDDEYGEGF